VTVPADVEMLQRDIFARQNRELNTTGTIGAYLVSQLVDRPAAVLKLLMLKAANSWYATDSSRYDGIGLLLQLIYIPLLMLGAWGAWRQRGRSRQLTIVICAVGLYFWVMTVMALSIVRYMVPAIGLMFLLLPAAYHLAAVNSSISLRWRRVESKD
jgi:hypothetical protein